MVIINNANFLNLMFVFTQDQRKHIFRQRLVYNSDKRFVTDIKTGSDIQ